ncbi:hypothetical protein RchiOBHm_Chr1g0334091 [Rosa chinensis]|uniref:Uncharacterized protein n=1 Tax=Rosa chinensis TaxID=74649 RepID=A0A2P6SC73_ROSCH|nr:hypothetical protein RchiOBHm_Chr1g0334091 [Rosa chinensis]
MIQTINPTIKQASGLKYLNTSNCKCLQSLPELPCLPALVGNGCPSLKTVSYPMTAPTRDLNQRHSFCACINLDENTRSNMMDDAWAVWVRIVRMATVSLSLSQIHTERVSLILNRSRFLCFLMNEKP